MFINKIKRYSQTIPLASAVLLILMCISHSANGQSANELVEKAKAALATYHLDEAIAFCDKAIALDKKLWMAYRLRGQARFRRIPSDKSGYSTANAKLQWHKALDDLIKASDMLGNDYDTYEDLAEPLWLMQLNSDEDEAEKFYNELYDRVNTFYRRKILVSKSNVCAYLYLERYADFDKRRGNLQAAIDNFDGVNGGECSADAAVTIAEQLEKDANGDLNILTEALKYYELTQKLYPPKNLLAENWVSKLRGEIAAAQVKATPVPTPQTTPTVEPRPTPSRISAADSALQAVIDQFTADFLRTNNELDPVVADVKLMMAKLNKAVQDDAKYGTDTNKYFIGTRKRAQSDLDLIHSRLRSLMRKYEGSVPQEFIDQIRAIDRRLPETVP